MCFPPCLIQSPLDKGRSFCSIYINYQLSYFNFHYSIPKQFSPNSFWSLDEVVGDLRIHVRPYVCASVCHAVARKPFITFSETLQLVRACKREKNFPSAFLKKIPVLPILAKNCPKLAILAQNAQKWRLFAFFCNPFIRIC